MEKVVVPIYEMKTLADAINSVQLPKWKKWILKKVIPSEFHKYAPQTWVNALPAGSWIANMQIMYDMPELGVENNFDDAYYGQVKDAGLKYSVDVGA